MIPEAALELSVEQLISALNKKLFMEYARVHGEMPPMSRALVATLSAEIDALEKRTSDVLHEIVTLRNSLRPVNRLPPEVLASCATFVSDADPTPIVSLTHVCRYWRRSICSSPRRWASIASGWKRLVPLCLERSGAVPLTVDITVSDIKNDGNFLELLIPHISKVGRLRIAGYSSIEAVENNLSGLFASKMPSLSSLELQQDAEPASGFTFNKVTTPPIFQNVSKLKSLRLTRAPIYPALFNITSLKELKLLGYANPLDFETFIQFLRSNLSLESAVLEIQFGADSVEVELARKVSLSRLQHLSISCSKEIDSRRLLSSISLPRGVNIEVTFDRLTPKLLIDSLLPSPLTPIHDLLTPITILKTRDESHGFQVFGNGSSFTLNCPSHLVGLGAVFELFPIAAVREIHLGIRRFAFCGEYISYLIEFLPVLETLAIYRAAAFPFELLLTLTEEPVVCPVLKTIAFFDCGTSSNATKKLAEALTRRRDLTAVRVYRVVIVSSNGAMPDRASVQRLRKSVPCVDVRMDETLPDLS